MHFLVASDMQVISLMFKLFDLKNYLLKLFFATISNAPIPVQHSISKNPNE